MLPPEDLTRPLPQGFRRFWVRVAGLWLHLVAGGQGPPLLLVHGLGGSCEDFYDMMPHLASTRTCVAPDLPGFGWSSKPDAAYTPGWFVAILADLAQALGVSRGDWLGHSMGGHNVLWLAIDRPDLVRRVAALCPAGGASRLGPLNSAMFWLLTDGDDRLRFMNQTMLRLSLVRVFSNEHHPARQDMARRQAGLWALPDRPLRERAMVRAARGIFDNAVWPHLGRLRAPVMLVEATRDWMIDARQTERLASLIPDLRLRLRLDTSHMAPYTKPGELSSAVIGFLDE